MQVAFYKGTRPGLDGLFNRLIRWWTRGPYSHCEIVFEDDIGRNGGVLCASSSWVDGGVRLKYIRLNPDHWDTVWVTNNKAVEKSVRQWFASHAGCKYDFRGIIGFVFRNVGDDRRKYFCSESNASALGYDEAWRFDPNTFDVMLRRKSA